MVQTSQVTQRVSFPKMLFSGCAPKFSDAIVELRDDLDPTLQRIRPEQFALRFLSVRGVDMLAKARSPHVSVRAMNTSRQLFSSGHGRRVLAHYSWARRRGGAAVGRIPESESVREADRGSVGVQQHVAGPSSCDVQTATNGD
jgi:hypothetical protein